MHTLNIKRAANHESEQDHFMMEFPVQDFILPLAFISVKERTY